MDPQEGTQGQEPTGTGEVGEGGQGSGEEQQQQQQTQEPDYSLANGFLSEIENEEHRKLLEPYVQKWDAGVTRRFQELHSKYRPYEEFGPVEEVQQMRQIYQALDKNPEGFFQLLAQQLGYNLEDTPAGQGTGEQGPGEQEGSQLPPEFQTIQQQVMQQQQVLQTVAEMLLNQHKTAAEQQEDAELDSYFSNLKKELGDFDESYVASRMMNGETGEQAVKAFQKMVQDRVNQSVGQRSDVVPILSGGGNVPGEVKDVRELSSGDVKKVVAEALAAANQQQ